MNAEDKKQVFDNPYMDDDDEQMEVGIDCCEHMVPYGGECYECDEYDEEYASSCLALSFNAATFQTA